MFQNYFSSAITSSDTYEKRTVLRRGPQFVNKVLLGPYNVTHSYNMHGKLDFCAPHGIAVKNPTTKT